MTDKALLDFIFDFLDSRIPASYHFHDLHHTRYVYEKASEIAHHENCSTADIRLVQAAALLHDTGYVLKYQGHEEESCKLAREFLPRFSYTPDEIDIICSMIMATRIPQTPKNKLEEILADADLEYLGTDLAEKEAGLLFKEMECLNPALTASVWDEQQVNFISKHTYFTDYCQSNREPKKQVYLSQIINRVQSGS